MRLTKELAAAEVMVAEQTASLIKLKTQLQDAEERAARSSKELAERETKVRCLSGAAGPLHDGHGGTGRVQLGRECPQFLGF